MQQLRKYAKIPEPSLRNVHMHQWRNCWKQRYLCGLCQGYIWSWLCIVIQFGRWTPVSSAQKPVKTDRWSWRLAAGSQPRLGASSWIKYQLKPEVRVWGQCEITTTLWWHEPRWRGTSNFGSHYQAMWLRILVCVWQWSEKCSHKL
jgi:hypothetical protein